MSLAGRSILILEDEPLLAFDYADELADRGAEPTILHTVKDALELVSREMPDLAVLDVNLGQDLCWPVATLLTAHHVPFLLVSGWVMEGRIPPEVKPEDCLEKPVGAHDVADRLMKVIQREG